jgi:hypothetical protein
MPPLKLSDEQLTAIMRGAAPLAPNRRSVFLREVADALATAGEIGDGTVNTAIRTVQKRHFDVPELSHDISKYR